MSEEKVTRVEVAGVGVELKAIKGKSLDELKKMEIFNHLDEEDQEKAYEELMNHV